MFHLIAEKYTKVELIPGILARDVSYTIQNLSHTSWNNEITRSL